MLPTDTDAPPGFKGGGDCGSGPPPPGQDCGDWLRTGYTKGSDGLSVEFHHTPVEGAGPLTFKLRESWPHDKPTHHGWLTYATPRGPLPGPQDGYEFLHSNGTRDEAMIIEFQLTNQNQGEYAMINLGKAGDMRDPATKPPSYISYHSVGNSHWVCSIDPHYTPWKAADAMTVELWKAVRILSSSATLSPLSQRCFAHLHRVCRRRRRPRPPRRLAPSASISEGLARAPRRC